MADALEWLHEENLKCSGCGQPMDESMDEEIRTAWIAERKTCWSCASSERVVRTATKDGGQLPPGSRFLTRNRAKDRC